MITVEFGFLVFSPWKLKEILFRFLDETSHHIEFSYCDLFSVPMC